MAAEERSIAVARFMISGLKVGGLRGREGRNS
jgi:hypothetical protein